MGISHFIVAGLMGSFSDDWPNHRVAGWVAVVFVWVYEINFGYSWGVSTIVSDFSSMHVTDPSLAWRLGTCLRSLPIGCSRQRYIDWRKFELVEQFCCKSLLYHSTPEILIVWIFRSDKLHLTWWQAWVSVPLSSSA